MTDPQIREATRIVEAASDARPAVIRSFFDEDTFTVTHVISDPATARAAIIDSVLDFDPASGRTSFASADKVIDYIQSEGLEVEWLLETHAHADHLSAAPYLQEKLGGTLAIGRHILTVQEVFGKIFNEGTRFARDGSQFDRLFDDGDRFQVGSIEAIALHVPGHTPADMAYVIGDAAFIGDTLFMPDYGTARADFPGLLARCHVSVSQAGYNTVMDILSARARAVLVPFAAANETEQTVRAQALARRGWAVVCEEAGLTPDTLAAAVDRAATLHRPDATGLRRDGAAESARLIRHWLGRRRA